MTVCPVYVERKTVLNLHLWKGREKGFNNNGPAWSAMVKLNLRQKIKCLIIWSNYVLMYIYDN